MGRNVLFGQHELTLRLTGLNRLFAIKSKVVIPYETVQHVYVDYFDAPKWMLRMPGTSIAGLHLYEGSFKFANQWYFLSFGSRTPLVQLVLAGHEKYRHVIFQTDDPARTASDIRRQLRQAAEASL
ncbi:hypothetical protein [Paenibacillus methanolicus]|uniref:PH (Pleckstrin Homology) domain-containing protein n=1 Tax=Paenibacillus methanolicus TaxID=582686 RepID=A0A5S5BWQ8_9BACL|nr:hypothetical protein [Paenibacillus methanolicus]TYP70063.1 hypothetical protein BCM02_11241 [Paenibacillus methanolicus]